MPAKCKPYFGNVLSTFLGRADHITTTYLQFAARMLDLKSLTYLAIKAKLSSFFFFLIPLNGLTRSATRSFYLHKICQAYENNHNSWKRMQTLIVIYFSCLTYNFYNLSNYFKDISVILVWKSNFWIQLTLQHNNK